MEDLITAVEEEATEEVAADLEALRKWLVSVMLAEEAEILDLEEETIEEGEAGGK